MDNNCGCSSNNSPAKRRIKRARLQFIHFEEWKKGKGISCACRKGQKEVIADLHFTGLKP